jgi:hypothetical protein
MLKHSSSQGLADTPHVVWIRTAAGRDLESLTEYFEKLSEASRYNRFMGGVGNFSRVARVSFVPCSMSLTSKTRIAVLTRPACLASPETERCRCRCHPLRPRCDGCFLKETNRKPRPMNCHPKRALLGTMLFAAILMLVTILLSAAQLFAQESQVPPAIAVLGEVSTAVFHAEGVQIYQCESSARHQFTWQPREPIATLILDGETVGRQYAGLRWGHVDETKLRWDHVDGSAVQAKIVADAPGASPDDIPWLRLDVISQTGDGALYGVTAVQRINTKGGMAQGSCEKAGSYLDVPYSADYVFWRGD